MMVYRTAQRTMASKPPRKTSSARSSSSRLPSTQPDPENNENEPPKPSPKKTASFRSDSSKETKLSIPTTGPSKPDAFETADQSDDDDHIEITRASVDLDELPIELVQLIDK